MKNSTLSEHVIFALNGIEPARVDAHYPFLQNQVQRVCLALGMKRRVDCRLGPDGRAARMGGQVKNS